MKTIKRSEYVKFMMETLGLERHEVDSLSDEAKFIAIDEDKSIFSYSSKPNNRECENQWIGNAVNFLGFAFMDKGDGFSWKYQVCRIEG